MTIELASSSVRLGVVAASSWATLTTAEAALSTAITATIVTVTTTVAAATTTNTLGVVAAG